MEGLAHPLHLQRLYQSLDLNPFLDYVESVINQPISDTDLDSEDEDEVETGNRHSHWTGGAGIYNLTGVQKKRRWVCDAICHSSDSDSNCSALDNSDVSKKKRRKLFRDYAHMSFNSSTTLGRAQNYFDGELLRRYDGINKDQTKGQISEAGKENGSDEEKGETSAFDDELSEDEDVEIQENDAELKEKLISKKEKLESALKCKVKLEDLEDESSSDKKEPILHHINTVKKSEKTSTRRMNESINRKISNVSINSQGDQYSSIDTKGEGHERNIGANTVIDTKIENSDTDDNDPTDESNEASEDESADEETDESDCHDKQIVRSNTVDAGAKAAAGDVNTVLTTTAVSASRKSDLSRINEMIREHLLRRTHSNGYYMEEWLKQEGGTEGSAAAGVGSDVGVRGRSFLYYGAGLLSNVDRYSDHQRYMSCSRRSKSLLPKTRNNNNSPSGPTTTSAAAAVVVGIKEEDLEEQGLLDQNPDSVLSYGEDGEEGLVEGDSSKVRARAAGRREKKGKKLDAQALAVRRHKLWLVMARKDVVKSQRTRAAAHKEVLHNCKRVATAATKIFKQKAIQSQKVVKDKQWLLKRMCRSMQVEWKKYDRLVKEQNKRAEKEAEEQRKMDKEIMEAKRQQRKVNFLITLPELYSHFMQKKMTAGNTGSLVDEASNTILQQLEDSTPSSSGLCSEQDDFDSESLKAHAIKTAQNAVLSQKSVLSRFSGEASAGGGGGGGITTATGEKEFKQPDVFVGQLKSYQMKGMNWIANLYYFGINGILADEMGLGKTVQAIAFLAHICEEYDTWGPFLIVTPASTLHNWTAEINRFVPEFKVVPYWGTPEERKSLRKFFDAKHSGDRTQTSFHIVVTSYHIVIQDFKFLNRLKWNYMVLDEAQAIKSINSQRWKLLLGFNCRNRLLLSGTPIQNTMAELWALLHFIMPTLFDSHQWFNEWFSKDIEGHAENRTHVDEKHLNRLHTILKPFMLRRLKTEVENELTDKIEVMVYCPLTLRQKFLYSGLKNKISIEELLHSSSGSSAAQSSAATTSLMNLVMQFRKVCNHPELLERREVLSPVFMIPKVALVPRILYDLALERPLARILSSLSPMTPQHIHQQLFADNLDTSSISSSNRWQSSWWFGSLCGISVAELSAVLRGDLLTCLLLSHMLQQHHHKLARHRQLWAKDISLNTHIYNSSRQIKMPYESGGVSNGLKCLLLAPLEYSKGCLKPLVFCSPESNFYGFRNYVVHSMPETTSHRIARLNKLKRPRIEELEIRTDVSPVPAASQSSNSTKQPPVISPNRTRVVSSSNRTQVTSPTRSQLITSPPRSQPAMSPNRSITSPGRHQSSSSYSNPQLITSPNRSQLSNPIKSYSISSPNRSQILTCSSKLQLLGSPGRPQLAIPSDSLVCSPHTTRIATVFSQSDDQDEHACKAEDHEDALSGNRTKIEVRSSAEISEATLGPVSSLSSVLPHIPRAPITRHCQPTHLPTFLTNTCPKVMCGDRRLYCYGQRVQARSNNNMQPRNNVAVLQHGLQVALPKEQDTGSSCRTLALEDETTGGLAGFPTRNCWSNVLIPDKHSLMMDAGKLYVLDSLLSRMKTAGNRVLIYSQMTKMINLLEEYMRHRQHKYMRLDGSSKISDRRDMVADFQSKSDIFVFLLSTRAGGVGINLTAADTVIFYDSDWNPTVDQQAMDRAHRVGQTKQVTVYRLICKGTIEERILQRAKEKSEIQRMVISGGNFKPDTLKPKEVVSLLLDDDIEQQFRARQDERRALDEQRIEYNREKMRKRYAEKKLEREQQEEKRRRIEEDVAVDVCGSPAPSLTNSSESEEVAGQGAALDETSNEFPLLVDEAATSSMFSTDATMQLLQSSGSSSSSQGAIGSNLVAANAAVVGTVAQFSGGPSNNSSGSNAALSGTTVRGHRKRGRPRMSTVRGRGGIARTVSSPSSSAAVAVAATATAAADASAVVVKRGRGRPRLLPLGPGHQGQRPLQLLPAALGALQHRATDDPAHQHH